MADGPEGTTSGPVELLGIASLFVVPWDVLTYGDGATTLLFAWGVVDPASFHVTDVYAYLFTYTQGVPDWILAWPIGVVCLALALLSATLGFARGWEDTRVTAGLIALVGVAALVVALGFSVQPDRIGIPIGVAGAWPLTGWYWFAVRGT